MQIHTPTSGNYGGLSQKRFNLFQNKCIYLMEDEEQWHSAVLSYDESGIWESKHKKSKQFSTVVAANSSKRVV